jgi:hypothetical protein
MTRRVFISYKYTDREVAHNVHVFFQAQGGVCQGQPAFVEEDVAPEGDPAIKEIIQSVMKGCAAVLFVVGDDSHNSPWIEYEAKLARNWGLRMVAVRAPNTTGAVPNEIKNQVTLVDWAHDSLCAALNKAGS